MQTNSRIEDVLPTLNNPEEYVRGIIANFMRERFSQEKAIIRIGVSGIGYAPHYCIEEGCEIIELGGDVNEHLIGKKIKSYQQRIVFDGRNHKQILEDQPKGMGWSSESMTFAEVQAILGRLRSSKKIH